MDIPAANYYCANKELENKIFHKPFWRDVTCDTSWPPLLLRGDFHLHRRGLDIIYDMYVISSTLKRSGHSHTRHGIRRLNRETLVISVYPFVQF